MKTNIILFDDFETLDAFGPVEVFGKLEKHLELGYYSLTGGIVKSAQNIRIETLPFSSISEPGIILIPGGMGTRREVCNSDMIDALGGLVSKAEYVLTVCTGSGLLAKTGLIKNKRFTSNKMAFDWASSQDQEVAWVKRARWVKDGKFYSSSGVSAGIDMALGFISDRFGKETAERIACGIEYIWNEDNSYDPFSGE